LNFLYSPSVSPASKPSRTRRTAPAGRRRLGPASLSLRDLTFQYPGAEAPVLRGLNLHVPAGALVSGYPAIDNRGWLRSSAIFAKLPELQRRLRELERRVADLLAGKPPA
jgi:hypothetical protein